MPRTTMPRFTNQLAQAARANSSNFVTQESSWSDGTCASCGEPVEIVGDVAPERHTCCVCGDFHYVRISVGRDDPRFGKAQLCECQQPGGQVEPFDAGRSRIPPTLAGATFANWLPDNGGPRLRAQGFIAEWPDERFILVLSGPPGRGKTHLAVAVLRAAWERHGKRGRFYVVPELLDRLRRTNDAEYRVETTEQVHAEFGRAAIVVLDDLGTERVTGYAEEQLFRLVDMRYRNRWPLVVTTNLQTSQIDARLFSRLCDRRCALVVEVDGQKYPDRRLSR